MRKNNTIGAVKNTSKVYVENVGASISESVPANIPMGRHTT
jgi:hypothetical protein